MKNRIILTLLLTISTFALFADDVTPSVDVTEGGVGIGTDNPQEMLDVNGRIRDQSGMVMPVGSIIPFAGRGDAVPEGWLLCDGRAMQAEVYQDLHQVIGTIYGDGSTDTRVESITDGDFNLPDLRGMFMRGVNNPETDTDDYSLVESDKDPDEATERLAADGTISTGVGTTQQDAFQGWQGAIGGVGDGDPIYYSKNRLDNFIVNGTRKTNHGLVDYLTSAQGDASMLKPANDGTHGDPRTSNETRPKNIYVNYIIKY